MRVDLFEEESGYWEAKAYPKLGHSVIYSDYKTAGDCIDYLLSVYHGERLNVAIFSLEAYNKGLEGEETNA